jgi:predicted nucleotidyltransferase
MEPVFPSNNQNLPRFEENLKKYFESRQDINFSLVFGSYANNKNHSFSDLDIGVHCDVELDILEIGNMIGDLESITNIKIDLLILNDIYENNSTIAYEIICNHKVINSKSENIFLHFKTKTYLHYFDDEPLREMKRKSLQKRIESNQIGKTNFVNNF